jgi:hypothetical protein
MSAKLVRTGAAVAALAAAIGLSHSAVAQEPLTFRDLGKVILGGTSSVRALQGARTASGDFLVRRPVAGFGAAECTMDASGTLASVTCTDESTLEEPEAKRVLEVLLKQARAELAPDWKESPWIGAKIGASFKHASGAEINIGVPSDLGAGLPGPYGPVLVIALSPLEPRR